MLLLERSSGPGVPPAGMQPGNDGLGLLFAPRGGSAQRELGVAQAGEQGIVGRVVLQGEVTFVTTGAGECEFHPTSQCTFGAN